MTDKLAHDSSATGIVAMADQMRCMCSVITKIARADLDARLKEHESGIGAIEHGVLRHLSHGITSMAEISRLMGVAPSTLVYVVDGLVKKKLVRRGKDPKDRRREPLLIEKRGADLFATIPKMEPGSALVESLRRMTEARRRALVELLEEFVGGLAGAEGLYLRSESEQTKKPRRPAHATRRAASTRRARKRIDE